MVLEILMQGTTTTYCSIIFPIFNVLCCNKIVSKYNANVTVRLAVIYYIRRRKKITSIRVT